MISEIEKRIECRMTGELCDKAVMREISQTVLDRICIRLGISSEKEFPALFNGVCAEASVKAYRRRYYEGIKSENASGVFSDTFIDDILSEYESEFSIYRNSDNVGSSKRVRFL
ncbi:hypothetical protein [uncultured Catenibacterium sp.]|uniref:hypothetical protein n=1 Tax=uncultured Catenibacterium sp. TaxID=286142 RepID=UPI0025976F9F|nr:hypothetical protein [uncultured Catenibacterium sp.]